MSKRVLIVDDEPNIVISVEFLMKREGFDVSVARDGEEGLAAIRDQRPDLVVLDVMMPKRNGFDVYAAPDTESGMVSRLGQLTPVWVALASDQEFSTADCSPALSALALEVFLSTAESNTERLLQRRR